MSSNKTIAKNTLFLYFRMMFTMVISLFTSRVILQALGVDDYGIYQTVGGLVAMLSFINSALATGTSRFLTFELGTGNTDKLHRTFSTVLSIHIILCVFVVLIAETVGLWFVYNKLIIAQERLESAVFTYHFSIVAVVFSITQVPYNACIIAHEKMSIYAYTSIAEVMLKLLIVYLLYISPFDKLKSYAVLYGIVNIGLALFYRYYCIRRFEETHYKIIVDKPIIKDVLCYSGWNLFANTAAALNNQGATVLINLFFHPGVVAGRAIANQVNMAATQFVTNFRTAANPQIVKRYAAGDIVGSKSLLLSSTKYSFYLMLLLSLPICFLADPLLHLWLGVVPEYSVVFLQFTIVTSLFQVFDLSFYTALYAKGRIRENALISPTILFLVFPIVYICYKNGYSPVIISVIQLVAYAILGLLVKPLLIIKIADYSWNDILSVFVPCLNVSVLSCLMPLLYLSLCKWFVDSSFLYNIILFIISFFSVFLSIWMIGLDKEIRHKLFAIIMTRLKKIQ